MTFFAALSGLAALIFAFLYFSDRHKINRVSTFATRMVEGKKTSALPERYEPFRSLMSNIERLADTLDQRVQTAREEKKRLFAILGSMTEGVMVVDTEEKVLLANSALETYFGLQRESIEGRFFWEAFRDADINQMIRQALHTRVAATREHAASMSPSTFEIQIAPVSMGGEFLGVVAVFRDVTMLKEYERLRTEFVANVSHELKTPLTSILGFVETLKEGGVNEEDRAGFLAIIESQAQHLHTLIEDLLYLSKIESMHEPLRLEPVDIEKTFLKLAQTFARRLKDDKIELRVMPQAKEIALRAESPALERALSNLVDNALKYNKPGGSVTLEASREGEMVVLKVHDTGIGIAVADLPRVFERFYRVEKGRARETGGTGLGLSIVKHVAERHGGRVVAESVPGKGSTFSIILPRQIGI